MSTISTSTWHRLMIAAALLLFAAQFVTALIPTGFEASGAVTWVEQHRMLLQVSNEFRFFAVLTLAAALLTWHASVPTSARRAVGFSALGLAVVVELFMVVAEGRLAYPIPGLDLDDATAASMIAMSYGASHAASILFAVAALALMLELVPPPAHGSRLRPSSWRAFRSLRASRGCCQQDYVSWLRSHCWAGSSSSRALRDEHPPIPASIETLVPVD